MNKRIAKKKLKITEKIIGRYKYSWRYTEWIKEII